MYILLHLFFSQFLIENLFFLLPLIRKKINFAEFWILKRVKMLAITQFQNI